jgi:hypothetical protein
MIGMPRPDDETREPKEPGERPGPAAARETHRLAEAPSNRYAAPAGPDAADGRGSSALAGPLARAALVAVVGALLLTVVGAILALTAGLLFVAGLTGAAVGLALSRAAVAGVDVTPVSRTRVAWLAIGLALAAVALAGLATWIYARGEGGTLGLVDYLLATFGPFIPAEALIAAVTAWWGASTGPVQS